MGLHPSFKSFLYQMEYSTNNLYGKTIAVDAYIILYKLLTTTIKNDGSPYFSNGKNVSAIIGMSRTYEKIFKSLNINPIFVFDGKPLEEKYETIKERNSKKNDAYKKYEEAKTEGNFDDMKKYSVRTVKITYDIVSSFKEYISTLGYSYVNATHDAEAVCAELVNNGFADYALTQDTDTILYGCNGIIRNLKSSTYDLVSSERILRNLNLTNNQLIYLAIITGTDYNVGIYGIGANKGLKYVKNANSIEEVLHNLVADGKINSNEADKLIERYKRSFDIFKETQKISENDIIRNNEDHDKRNLILKQIFSEN